MIEHDTYFFKTSLTKSCGGIGCANIGLRVVRLGRPEAIRPELLKYCIDRPPERDGRSGNSDFSYGGMSTSAFKERMKVLKNAQVVCCTCIGSGGDILDSMTFERVMVDEGTQATEPAVLVPLTRGCRQLVLVGDHCQVRLHFESLPQI